MRMPLPARTGSRTRICGASGGGKAPFSDGSISLAGASFAAVTGRQPGAVVSDPLSSTRMVRSAALVIEALRDHARLGEERRQGVRERPVARLEPVEHGMRALGLARLGQPALRPLAKAFAAAPGLGCRQARGPGPAGENHGLGGEQGCEKTRPLVENVAQLEAEPRRLPPGPRTHPLHLRAGLVGSPLQHQVERMAGRGESAVEAPAGHLHEALQLGRSGHGARPVDAEQRHQRAVGAGQKAVADGRLRQHEALQRLAPERPARRQRVLEGAVHRGSQSLGRATVWTAPPRPKVSERPLITAGAAISATPIRMAMSPDPSVVCCG